MGLTTITHGATTVAASALHSVRKSRPVDQLDPYTAWMMRHLPSPRAWHR